jgi:hypothetical protein
MAQNRTKPFYDPIEDEIQFINDLEMGWTVRNIPKAPFKVLNGYTRVYPNLTIPDGITVEIEDGGELIV